MRLALLALTLSLVACTGPANGPPLTVDAITVSAADRDALVAGNTEFAARMYRELAAGEDGNLFFSPWSISAALAMTHAGARGNTADEIAAGLAFTLPDQRLRDAFQSQTATLQQSGGPNEIRIANAFWADSKYPFAATYLDRLRQSFGATAENADFENAPDDARGRINNWVSEQTNDRINDLFPPGSIDDLTRLVLTNAVYFKGTWREEFDADETRDEPWKGADGSERPVPLMRNTEDFLYHRGEDFQLLSMGYEDSTLAMLIALPDDVDGLPLLEESLSGETLQAWTSALHHSEVHVFLPRFELAGEFGLRQALEALGVRDVFTEAADLSGMDGTTDLLVQSVRHKAWVKVDEQGTEAAAATGVAVGVLSAPAQPTPVFRADHPFLFLIHDRETGSILFLGRVVSP